MTDIQTLCAYRLNQAEETLSDAKKMLANQLSSRSVINRAYYSIFYAILALFLKAEIRLKTSKHQGVISMFDKDFIHTGRIDKRYSIILHKVFDARQEGDYREFVKLTQDDAAEAVNLAEDFIEGIKKIL